MNIDQEVKALAARYADYGVDEKMIRELMEDKETPSGLDDRAKLICLRLVFGNEFNEQEYFSVEEIAHITGQSEDATMKMMLDGGANPIEVSFAPWLKGE